MLLVVYWYFFLHSSHTMSIQNTVGDEDISPKRVAICFTVLYFSEWLPYRFPQCDVVLKEHSVMVMGTNSWIKYTFLNGKASTFLHKSILSSLLSFHAHLWKYRDLHNLESFWIFSSVSIRSRTIKTPFVVRNMPRDHKNHCAKLFLIWEMLPVIIIENMPMF